LFWTLFSFNFNIPNNELNHIIVYVIYNEFCCQVANTSSLHGSHNEVYNYTLDDLKFANTLYDVRVYLKSALASGEDKWSAPTINTFRTKPTREYTDNLSSCWLPFICCHLCLIAFTLMLWTFMVVVYTYIMNFHGCCCCCCCCCNVEWSRSVWNIKKSFGMVLGIPLWFCAVFFSAGCMLHMPCLFSVYFWSTAKFH